jgi:4-diphosphocytidyl-2-C-methyl-D-erythritol kinase
MAWVTVPAPAKLTLSLRVTGVRHDGMHLLEAEMVTIDLADTLTFEPGAGISVVDDVVGGLGIGRVPSGPDNLVARALALVGHSAAVRIVKRVPAGAGLGGGSADAAAVLRWMDETDPGLAARLGADVPFCVVGGRARVTGTGDVVEPLPFEDRRFVLLLPPLSVDTSAVYRVWDRRQASVGAGELGPASHGNDLEAAAIEVAPVLAHWRDRLEEVSGQRPRLAGSGSAWFVEGEPDGLGIAGRDFLVLKDQRAPLVIVRSLAAASPD